MALILHVDWDKKTTCFSKCCLQPRGHSVISASDGDQAEVAMELHPDLIITNLTTPGEKNDAHVSVLKHSWAYDVPVIVLTSASTEGARPIIEGLPKARLLRKPCDEAQLAGLVDELLPKRPH